MSSRSAELAHELAATIRELVLLTRQATPDLHVSVQQLGVLGSLAEGSRRISALAAEHAVRMPTMTGLVSRLEQVGAVVRGSDADDGRAVAVEITGHGRRVLAEGRSAREEFLGRRLEALTPAEQEAVRAALPALSKLSAPPAGE